MKCGVIIYHKDIYKIYKKEWIQKCLDSIYSQTYQDFSFLELNYGNDDTHVIPDDTKYKVEYWNKPMKNHVYAMNYLLDKAFNEYDYETVFNINLDDYYSKFRFEYQIKYIGEGYDIVSSNFILFEEGNPIEQRLEIAVNHRTQDRIQNKLLLDKNIIAHPCVAYRKHFWKKVKYYNVNDIPIEDLKLWKRAIKLKLKFKILPQFLLHHRLHNTQITAKNRKRKFILKRGHIII